MKRKEDFYEGELKKMRESEFRLQEKVSETLKVVMRLESEITAAQNDRQKMEDELNKNISTHEAEVSLRLRFEEKLNNLHAVNRVAELSLHTT